MICCFHKVSFLLICHPYHIGGTCYLSVTNKVFFTTFSGFKHIGRQFCLGQSPDHKTFWMPPQHNLTPWELPIGQKEFSIIFGTNQRGCKKKVSHAGL